MHTTGLKALIIEDRRENIVFLANAILKPKGFEVISARDGKAGLRKALEESPDLIIADLNLPKMSGIEIIADLRDRGSFIPVIVTTLHGSAEMAVDAFRLGARDYLIKPLKTEEVEAALQRVFDAPLPAQSGAHNPDHTAKLEGIIADLEQRVNHQDNEINLFKRQERPIKQLTDDFEAQKQVLEEHRQKVSDLTRQLLEQTSSTTQARNQAQALVQFTIAQQKEIERQKKEMSQLIKQVRFLVENLSKFANRLDTQSHQLQMVVPVDNAQHSQNV